MVVHSNQQSVRLYVPKDDNWRRGLNPPHSSGAAWFLNLLHWKWICWRADPDGFVRLKSEYLRRVIPRSSLSEIRNVLVGSGVIDWDRSYLKGQRSMRYRLRKPYRRSRVLDCTDRKLCRKVRRLQRESVQNQLPVHQWLRDRQTLLEFDIQQAASIISGMFPDDDSPLDIIEYRALLIEQAERLDRQLHDGTPELTVCRFGRVHTAVTRLPASLRRCLSFEGQPLVGIDLRNSQPLFAGLATVEYCSSPVRKSRLNQFEPPASQPYGRDCFKFPIARPNQSPSNPPPITMAEKSQTIGDTGGYESCLCNNPDLKEYLSNCEQGKFYESLMLPGEDRGWIKRRVLIDSFFRSGCYESEIQKRLDATYPTVAGMLNGLRKHDHRRPSWIMQHHESTMFIGRIARRIMVEEPDIPLTTIHDSFLTTEEHAGYVEAVAMSEFARLGVTPTFKRETYD
jgi:hypothetical protein